MIYTGSRTRHAEKWLKARSSGVPIISTWIDEAGIGDTSDIAELWERCVNESKTAKAFILYREDNEPFKGALVELGAALGAGVPCFVVGCTDLMEYSFLNHPLVTPCWPLEDAFVLAMEVAA